jgi:hypothetical protein
VGETVPDGFGIDNQDGGMLALVEAAGFVDTDAMFEARGFDGVLECTAELLAVFIGAARAVGGFVALILADK